MFWEVSVNFCIKMVVFIKMGFCEKEDIVSLRHGGGFEIGAFIII